ncbi:Transmembrane 9 superfamily member 7 [Penicillium macrosclerotiorum]|uniref:Transmembrane 9 superfamily member 7 n=1 Tax=Penicillium macrosclerotiorum TaxID=303699 RepID=UPI0025471B9E|nr:Transmembrane 9 superfamily member 7 [Penicillium macrosclerotiorum]KAJ5679865.1 Transmembrane 9 superfamily member 7 [Penicillium macrosclerotiorum]
MHAATLGPFRPISWILPLLLLLSSAWAFYIPGYSVTRYNDDQPIPLLVNKIFSDHTQLQYAYFDLPFVCPPSGKSHGGSPFGSGQSISLNLGEVLRGDRIMTSDFELAMGKDVECQALCTREISRSEVKWARQLIKENYVIEWIVDNLPGATSFVTVDRSRKYYASGFKMGYRDISAATGQPRYFINNHFTIVIRWRGAPEGGKVIVGFEVYPKSVTAADRKEDGCPRAVHKDTEGLGLYIPPDMSRLREKYGGLSYIPEDDDEDDGTTLKVPYTYSVYFREETKVEWANRWDLYFTNQEEGSMTHWLAIINSLTISTVLGVTVFVIWSRTVQGDVKGRGDGAMEDRKSKVQPRRKRSGEKKNEGLLDNADVENDADMSSDDEPFEDNSGWKLLHGDVFRIPAYSGLLAPLVGSGMQLLFMATGLLVLSCLGILNPSFRGGFVSVGMGLFVFAGLFSGYFSGRLYKTFGGSTWRKNTLITALLFPGLSFFLVLILNLFVWAQASSTAIPFGTLVGLLALWLLIQVPLVYIGSWAGYVRASPWEHPLKTNAIPRQIPTQPWYLRSPAGPCSPDKSGYYYVFGFLSVVSVVLMVTVIEVTVIATYSQLCSENYHWWWQSFLTGGSSAFWVFAYCIWYYMFKLHVSGFVSGLLFFSYSFLACAVYGLLTGTVGFLAAYVFVRRVYSAIKVD